MNKRSVTVVVVLHNSGDVIAGCLSALPEGVSAVVVDNASADSGAEVAAVTRPDAIVERLDRNIGFGPACNRGAALAESEYLLFLNPDARITSEALDTLVDAAQPWPYTLFGPAITTEAGRIQHGLRRPSAPIQDIVDQMPGSHAWAPWCLRRDLPSTDPRYALGGEVAYVQGACMLVRREAFSEVGGFDEDFFLYGEEETLADRLRAVGGSCRYVPDALVHHIGGTSTAKVREFAVKHLYRSRILLYRKRLGPIWRLAGPVMVLAAVQGRLLWLRVRTLVRRPLPAEQYQISRSARAGVIAGIRACYSSDPLVRR